MLTLCEKIKNMLQIVIMKKTVIAYLHTHWDREWYREFEVFRLRLLRVFDNVLNLIFPERTGSLPSTDIQFFRDCTGIFLSFCLSSIS